MVKGEEKKNKEVVTSTTNRLKKGEEKKKKTGDGSGMYVFFLWGGGGEVLAPNVNMTKLSWGTVRVHKCIYGVDIDFLSSHKTFSKKKRPSVFFKRRNSGLFHSTRTVIEILVDPRSRIHPRYEGVHEVDNRACITRRITNETL